MKKFFALMLALVMSLSLVACGSDKPAAGGDGSAASGSGSASTLTTVQDGKLTMATNAQFPP